MTKEQTGDQKLENWYFARRELFDAPVGNLIEAHAQHRLSRALSVGRLTAFVGSGASMAYGRTSWIDMLVGVQEKVLKRYEEAEAKNSPQPSSEAKRLKKLLDQHKIKPSAAGDESKQLTVFQLAEKLHMTLDADAEHAGIGASENRSGSAFRRDVMQLTRDHRGHADRLAELVAGEHSQTDLLPKLKNHIRRVDPNERGRHAADLLNKPLRSMSSPDVNADDIRAVLTPKLDPLAIVLRDLGIKRFLTLNYDHEIEFALRSEQDPLNVQRFREIVFDEEQCGALIAAVVGGRHSLPFVAHLHGRAEEDEKGQLIVTEHDYRRRYHRPGGKRRLIDDAIRITFSSSPLLFLGIGMKEVDLLRPLKQFLGSDRYLGEQLAIALLPAMKSEKDLGFEKIDLLKKFGVYCVHYGRTELTRADGKTLPWFSTLFNVYKQITEVFDAVLPGGLATSREVQAHVKKSSSPICRTFSGRHVVLSQDLPTRKHSSMCPMSWTASPWQRQRPKGKCLRMR